MSKRWSAHCFVNGCKLQKSNCMPQDTQDSWSGQPKYRLNSIKLKYTLFQLCSSLLVSLSTGARKNRIFLLNTLDNVPRPKPSKGVHVMIICRSKRRLGRLCAELPYGTVLGKLFHWWIRGCVGNWVKIRPQNSPIMQFDTTPTQYQTRPQKSQSAVHSPLQKQKGTGPI